MDYKAIWNEICFHMSKNRHVSERDFQTTIEFLLEKLGWSQFKGEIVSQEVISVGSANSVKPDIIIKNEEQAIFVIELKKPNMMISERNVEQLRSYMRLLKLNFGILIGESLQLYYEQANDNKPPVKVVDIPFTDDSEKGIELIKFLSKNGYSFEGLKNYCLEKIAKVEEQKIAKKYITLLCSQDGEKLVADLLKEKLLKDFSENTALSVIDKINISISRKENTIRTKLQERPIRILPTENHKYVSENKITRSIAIKICKENGINLSRGNITFASKNKGSNNYWANPSPDFIYENWWIILNDFKRKKLHVFNIPANTISIHQIIQRNDNGLIDLQIKYNDDSFQDNRSLIQFKRWFVKTIAY